MSEDGKPHGGPSPEGPPLVLPPYTAADLERSRVLRALNMAESRKREAEARMAALKLKIKRYRSTLDRLDNPRRIE